MPLSLKITSQNGTPVGNHASLAAVDILDFAPICFEVHGTPNELKAAESDIYGLKIELIGSASSVNTPKETEQWYKDKKYPVDDKTGRIKIFQSACTIEKDPTGGADTVNLKVGSDHKNWRGTPNGGDASPRVTCLDNNRPILRGEYSATLYGIVCTELKFIVLPCRLWSLASLYLASLEPVDKKDQKKGIKLTPPATLKDFQPYQSTLANHEGPHFTYFPVCNVAQTNSTGAAGPPPQDLMGKIGKLINTGLPPVEAQKLKGYETDLQKNIYTLPTTNELIKEASQSSMACVFGHGPSAASVGSMAYTFQTYMDGYSKRLFRLDKTNTAQYFTNCHVAFFIGCNTGHENAGNLALRAVELGAKIAIGFTKTTQEKGYSQFIQQVFQRIVATADKDTALSKIVREEGASAERTFSGCNFDSWVIYYPATLKKDDWRVMPPRYADCRLAPSGTIIWMKDKNNITGIATTNTVL